MCLDLERDSDCREKMLTSGAVCTHKDDHLVNLRQTPESERRSKGRSGWIVGPLPLFVTVSKFTTSVKVI